MGPVLGFFGAVLFGAAAGASAAYVLAVNIARIALLSLISKALAPKIDLTQAASDKLLTVRSSFQPQAFVYGQDMLSGPLLFANTAGDGNKDLHRLVALTGREVDSFLAFRIDDTDIVIGVDIPDDNHIVTGGVFADVVEIGTRTGTSSQTAIPDLISAFPSNWTSAHQGRGWALFYTKMTLEGGNDAFEGGIPQNLRALVKGHKVYDPRAGSAQDVDDSTTWEWSNNPALCLADFLMWHDIGMGEDPERIDWDLVAAAANICEEQVVIPGDDSDGDLQNRYTCNFTFYSDQDRGSIAEILTTSMMGRLIFSQGKWRMWAGAAIAATVTLTEANLAGGVQLQASTPSESRYNRIRGKFVDPSRNYTANPYPEQRNSAYETDDNEIKYKTFDQNACNNSYEAQRNAIIRLRQSRMQRVLNWEGNWSCFRIQPGTTVNIDLDEFGFSGEKFFVTEWTLDKEGKGVNLAMVQEADSVWDDPDEYVTRTSTGDLVFADQGGLLDANIHNERVDATCYAGVRFGADGELYYQTANGTYSSSGVLPGQWRGTESGEVWIFVTVNSGDLDEGDDSDGHTGAWIPIDQDLDYSINQPTFGVKNANITVQLSHTADGSDIYDSATYDLEAAYITNDIFLTDLSPWTYYANGESQKAVTMPDYTAGDILVCFVFGASNTAGTPDFANPSQWDSVITGSTAGTAYACLADGTGNDLIDTDASSPSVFSGYLVAVFQNPGGLTPTSSTLKAFFNGTSETGLDLPAAAGNASPGVGSHLVLSMVTLTKASPSNTDPTVTPVFDNPYMEGTVHDYYVGGGSPRGVVWAFGWAAIDDSNTSIAQDNLDTMGESYLRYGRAVQVHLT